MNNHAEADGPADGNALAQPDIFVWRTFSAQACDEPNNCRRQYKRRRSSLLNKRRKIDERRIFAQAPGKVGRISSMAVPIYV
jgi:hypothetical protein